MIDGAYWMPSHRADPRVFALYARHYSAKKNWKSRRLGGVQFVAAGSPMVLLGRDCRAAFVWLKNTVERYDHQDGICCTLFRNESEERSEALIREADELAWAKWPGERHFTYVDADEVQTKEPGWCFLRARWRHRGKSKGGLLLLDKTQGPSSRWPRQ